jgi:heterotetrameric sarcosine oxidase gamma subunit
VSELQLAPRAPLHEEMSPRRIGRPDGPAGVTVHERTNLSLVLITARRGLRAACIDSLRASYDLDAPATPRIVHGRALSLAWAGPESWLAVGSARPDIETELKASVKQAASTVDMSDQRVVMRISGPMTRAVLTKGVTIDLHPRVFAPGDTAITSLANITTQLWQVDDVPTFDLVSPRATARDMFHWLTVSAAQFGLDVCRTHPER